MDISIGLGSRLKSILTMPQVADRYGYTPGRTGFISCPFHGGDRTPSCKIYPDGYHCFGCGAHGTIIDFVMVLFDISFSAACVRLNADFALGLTSDKPDPAALNVYMDDKAENARLLAVARAEYDRLCGEHRRLYRALIDKPPVLDGDNIVFDPEYIEACHRLDSIADYLQNNKYPR